MSQYEFSLKQNIQFDKLEILYEDVNYVIINKPYNMMIDGPDEITVEKLLSKQYPNVLKFYFVHQLDYPTSGVLCLATNSKACGCAGILFSKRLVQKRYVALVRGHVLLTFQYIDTPIASHPTLRYKMMLAEHPLGKVRFKATNIAEYGVHFHDDYCFRCHALKSLFYVEEAIWIKKQH
jgi:23S rRNA-/tRNA-specific pseudouridylate synthase